MVHTLRSEAIEAGEPARGAARAHHAGSAAHHAASPRRASVALALVLFLAAAAPALRSADRGRRLRPLLATAGFSDRVELGDLGRIRRDPTMALRVETLEGEAPPPGGRVLLAGLAFDRFDGRRWSVDAAGARAGRGHARSCGVAVGARAARVNLVQRIVREPVDLGRALRRWASLAQLQGTVRPRRARRERRPLRAPDRRRAHPLRDRRASRAPPADAALRDDRVRRPPRRAASASSSCRRSSPRVGGARRAASSRGAASDAERVARDRALAAPERAATPTRRPPTARARRARPSSASCSSGPTGHCEYFASAMVVLARSLGIPARLVNGFAGGADERDRRLHRAAAQSDAHTWVEVHYRSARAGCATIRRPPDLRARPSASALVRARPLARAPAARLELWWFRTSSTSTAPTRPRRCGAGSPGTRGARARRRTKRSEAVGARTLAGDAGPGRAMVLALPALLRLGAALLAAPRRAPRRSQPVPADYRRALRLLARRGLRAARRRDTARGFAGAPPRRWRPRRGPRLRAPDRALSGRALRRPPGRARRARGAARACVIACAGCSRFVLRIATAAGRDTGNAASRRRSWR